MSDLNRAWSRIGALGHGFIGRSVTPLWGEEQEIIFSRAIHSDDHGTFEEGWLTPYWTTRGQVDTTEPTRDMALAPGALRRVVLRVYIRFPDDPALLPIRGDSVTWSDSSGKRRTDRIATVIDPNGLHDHLEIESEGIE